jgi:DNA adenine methylase
MKPFLKWAGSKYRIVDRIKAVLPEGKRLIEPFAGSGAVFLNTNYAEYLVADTNQDLINLYVYLRDDQSDFVDFAQTFFIPENNCAARFQELRHEFNETQNIRQKSAILVYLNRHCFNGLCRYNSRGKFNVPFGRYNSPTFPRDQMLTFAVRAQNATFKCADFREIMNSASAGDVIYCDPPYVPLSATASFTDYATGGFGLKDQSDLADLANSLAEMGVSVVISNHDTEWTRQAYQGAAIHQFNVQRFIAAKATSRSLAAELMAVF